MYSFQPLFQIILAWTRRHRLRDTRMRTAIEKHEQSKSQQGAPPPPAQPTPGGAKS